jgi:roadblock/LC7 domain-containing protein
MATIDELLKLDGVATVGELRLDRGLVGYKANMQQ